MSKPTILAFTGAMGTGKSTAINHVQYQPPQNAKLIKFAQPLYDMQRLIYQRVGKPEVKDRKLLQWLGTEWGRSISETLWIDLWRKEVYKALAQDIIVLVDDCRFDNEAKAIKALGGKVVRLVGKTDKRDVVRGGLEKHASESGLSPELIDFTLPNNSTKKAFLDNVEEVYANFLEGKL